MIDSSVSQRPRPLRDCPLRGSWLFAVVVLLAGAPSAGAQISYNVTFDDPGGANSAFYAPIQSHVLAAGADWASRIRGNGTLDVIVQFPTNIPLGSGRSVTSSFVRNNGTFNVFEQGAAAKVRTGFDANGSAPDIELRFNPNYLANTLWFDPNPFARTAVTPGNKTDAMSVFIHELGHAFVFNGWRNHFNGTLPGDYESTFDEQTIFDGTNYYFVGPQAASIYGGSVPLTYGNIFHLGNNAPRPGSDLIPDLMNGVEFTNGTKYFISSLDTAIFADTGLPLAQIWNGAGGDNNWGGGNWQNGVPTSSPNTMIAFAGTTRLNPVQNLANPLVVNSITFAPLAGAFNLSGNAIEFRASDAGAAPRITQYTTSAVTINNPLVLAATLRVETEVGSLHLSGALSGTGGLTKFGPATLTLSGANTYGGGTTIAGGTLVVATPAAVGSATGSGAVTVNPPGRLTGSGHIAGALDVNGGVVAPGDGIGTLTTGATTFHGGSRLEIALGSAVPRPGGLPENVNANDVLAVTGAMTFDTVTNNMFLVLNGAGLSFAAGGTYDYFIASATGPFNSFNPGQVTIVPSEFAVEGTFTLQTIGNNLVVSFTPVPEPAFATLILVAAAAGACVRRRLVAPPTPHHPSSSSRS